VEPALLRDAGLDAQTTLARIQPHRLRTLILEDLERFPDSGRVDIHRRIGAEIHPKAVVRALDDLVSEGLVEASGVKRWRTYRLPGPHGQKS
jgi:ATP-dependent DNA helicase RecG